MGWLFSGYFPKFAYCLSFTDYTSQHKISRSTNTFGKAQEEIREQQDRPRAYTRMVSPPMQSKYLGLEQAAKSGQIEKLQIFTPKYIQCMPPFRQKQLCAMAAATGNVDCLQYLRDSGAQWDEMVPMSAAQQGRINCMTHAWEQGCPFDIRVCIYAAEAGQLAALRFAVETSGQSLNTAVAYAAAAKDNLDCLSYMVQRGCKVEPVIAGVAASRGAMSCLRFLVAAGVRLRACDIDYGLTHAPEGGQETASIRSKALCLTYALNLGAKLTQRHWNTAVGASAQRMLLERRKAFFLCIGHAKALTAVAHADETAAALSGLHLGQGLPEKTVTGKRNCSAPASPTAGKHGIAAPAGSKEEASSAEGTVRDCCPAHAPLGRIPKDVAEIIAGYAHLCDPNTT